ncbi:H-2 class II histocompatibility antigen, A-U alpha chain-like [Megalops cyprinoides]|uniref:H-2 class II histocompatibility antigen, A-U alpha chain-like n=1 Tax=Megalops cyprinoides TaxID=118141 RepID=UPI0018648048|nr:H-2 class II histocompatibility antigen, A-U alpha chain-like [Megalops cyprinoides]
MEEFFQSHCTRQATCIATDPSHPSHGLFTPCRLAEVPHLDITSLGCSDAADEEDVKDLDGDEMRYIDFNKKEAVSTLPEFADPMRWPEDYAAAVTNMVVCKNDLEVFTKAGKNPPLEKDPPQSTIYTKHDVEFGKENALICFVNNFYPPPVKVKWTKNDREVKEGVTLSRYHPNSDFTFRQLSTLSFTPDEGDIYACTVEHTALPEPQTKIWEPEVSPQAGVGATAFCGVGLTVGLLGVATGTFFLIKGNNCN